MAANAQDTEQQKNRRGIPHAPFIADVEKHLGGPDVEIEATMKQFQDALAKYRFMENNLTQRRGALEEKIPDIQKTLDMVLFLRDRREGKAKASEEEDEDDLEEGEGEKKPIVTTFELNDTLYAEAQLEDSDTVYLWLGANVMLSYKLPEAVELLTSKLEVAQQNLENLVLDLEYLKEQVTIMEVNTARLYNYDVKRRKEKREREAGKSVR